MESNTLLTSITTDDEKAAEDDLLLQSIPQSIPQSNAEAIDEASPSIFRKDPSPPSNRPSQAAAATEIKRSVSKHISYESHPKYAASITCINGINSHDNSLISITSPVNSRCPAILALQTFHFALSFVASWQDSLISQRAAAYPRT